MVGVNTSDRVGVIVFIASPFPEILTNKILMK